MEKKFKITLCILVIILICVISFAGMYTKKAASYESILPEYILDSEFTGKRISYFKVSDDTEQKIYDADGNEVDEIPEDANAEDYRTETVKVNLDESLTEENFNKSKEIFEGRLKYAGVPEYTVRLDRETGEMVVELPDDLSTDTYLQYLLLNGDFSMIDSEDKTVLLDKSDVKNASVAYANNNEGEVIVYLDIKFNKEGTKKLEEVSRNYLKQETEEDTQKAVSIVIEGSTIRTTYFGEVITNGELTLAIGSGTDATTLYEYANQAEIFAMLINNEEMPLTYTITTSEYVSSELNNNALYIIISALTVITLIVIIYLIIKYKIDGLLASLSLISGIAILLLLLRYTNVAISLGSFSAIAILIATQTYFIISILNSIKKDSSYDNVTYMTTWGYLKRIEVILVFLIISVVFTFMSELKIYSVGMTMFYGVISLIIPNLVFMRTMLINKHK